MLKRYFFFLISSLLLTSCIGYYKILKDNNGEPILNEKVNYKFAKIPSEEDLTKIDTSAYYIQVFEGRYYNEAEKQNPSIIVFHNDGNFKSRSLKYYSSLESIKRNKNSIYYGGKYQIKDNIIELEQFLPSKGTKTNYYSRNITRASIDGNKLIFNDGESSITVYEKKYELE